MCITHPDKRGFKNILVKFTLNLVRCVLCFSSSFKSKFIKFWDKINLEENMIIRIMKSGEICTFQMQRKLFRMFLDMGMKELK